MQSVRCVFKCAGVNYVANYVVFIYFEDSFQIGSSFVCSFNTLQLILFQFANS